MALVRTRSAAVKNLISELDKYFDVSPNNINLFNIFKTDEELLYYVRLSALLSETLKSQKMTTLNFGTKIALCEINKLYALTIRLYTVHQNNVKKYFEETQKFHSEMSVKAFQDNYLLLFDTILKLRIAGHEIQKQFISKFFINVFQSKIISRAETLLKSIENILNDRKLDRFTTDLANHMFLACSKHLRENSVGTRSTPPSEASNYQDYNFTSILDDQEPHQEDSQNSQDQESSSSGSSDDSGNYEVDYNRDTFFDFNEQKPIYTEKSGRSRSGAAMERLRQHDSVKDIFLKELPREKQIKTLLDCYKHRCRDAFSNMCIGVNVMDYFMECSTELMNTRGEIMYKMLIDYEEELQTFETVNERVRKNHGQYSYLANCKVFDLETQKTKYSHNHILQNAADLFNQRNLNLFGNMLTEVNWNPTGSMKMSDGSALDFGPIMKRISAKICNVQGTPMTLNSDMNNVSYDILKQVKDQSKGTFTHNGASYNYKFSVESVVLELPHTEGWQNPQVIAFINGFLKSNRENAMSFTLTILIDNEMEISILFQRYFPDSVIAYHYQINSESTGIIELPDDINGIIDTIPQESPMQSFISVTQNYEFTPYDEYSCLQIHASASKKFYQHNKTLPSDLNDHLGIGYVYHFNNWTFVVYGNRFDYDTQSGNMNVTYITLINKIPNEVLPRQSTSQLSLSPAAGAIPRMYPVVQRQQGPPKEYKLPEGKNWYIFGIVDTYLTAQNQSRTLDTLSFYYFENVDNETKTILDIGRRIITAEIAQEYYPTIQTLDNMNAYIGQYMKNVKSYHGMFVQYMLSEPAQVQRTSKPYVAYSEKWEEYLKTYDLYREPIREKSIEGEEILSNLKNARVERFRQSYNPLNPPNRRNPVPTPPRERVPHETVTDYAKRANRPQLVPEKSYKPWQPSSQTGRNKKNRFNGRNSGFEGYTAPERDAKGMGL